jgi:hypothetical protein
MNIKSVLVLSFTSLFAAGSSLAGHVIVPAKNVVEPEVRTIFPDQPVGAITLGAQLSEHASGGYFDSITGLWSPRSRDAFLFLNSRYHLEDNGQFISSTGLGFRKLLRDEQVIIGANAYWDSIHSEHDNDFNQLGLGFEILTHWVDARFNYYLPEDDVYEVDRSTRRKTHTSSSGVETTEKLTYKRFESSLEGFNAEIGFLIPGLDAWFETRVYAGYYHYDNPFGGDFEGFKARLEARLLPGVIAEVEYWNDAELMGGNWTAGLSVSVPFSIYNLVTGRNPFEGAGEFFRPRKREFEERMGDMTVRSHRIQTTTSGPRLTDRSVDSTNGGGSSGIGGIPLE